MANSKDSSRGLLERAGLTPNVLDKESTRLLTLIEGKDKVVRAQLETRNWIFMRRVTDLLNERRQCEAKIATKERELADAKAKAKAFEEDLKMLIQTADECGKLFGRTETPADDKSKVASKTSGSRTIYKQVDAPTNNQSGNNKGKNQHNQRNN